MSFLSGGSVGSNFLSSENATLNASTRIRSRVACAVRYLSVARRLLRRSSRERFENSVCTDGSCCLRCRTGPTLPYIGGWPAVTESTLLHQVMIYSATFGAFREKSQARYSCSTCVPATNTFTEKRPQFLGMITSEYRDQMIPVAASEADCEIDS
uniref:Uncharacterized protein n=1 Tax=Anopheles culicifacies TaxID=139723 RepID=A0A182MS22_9DIPT